MVRLAAPFKHLAIDLYLSSIVEEMPLEVQDAEENFDLSLLSSLEIDVVPRLGDPRVPDSLIIQLAKTLDQGSRLFHDSSLKGDDLEEAVLMNGSGHVVGSTESNHVLPRERFAYWCFDLMFLVCSDMSKGSCDTVYSLLGV